MVKFLMVIKMDELLKSRSKIDLIDQKIAELFVARMNEVKKIYTCKKSLGLPLLDETREEEILKNNQAVIPLEYLPSYTNFISNMLHISKTFQRTLQKEMMVAYQGTCGSYSHIMAKKLFPNATYYNYKTFYECYQSVVDGKMDICVLPLENSYQGDVAAVMDLAYNGPLYINDVKQLEIDHTLIGLPKAEITNIKTVVSHPQALGQCHDFILDHHLAVKEEINTAIACQKIKELNDLSYAAIASYEAAEIYGLKVLAERINTSRSNTTRFAVFSNALNELQGNHFILVFTVLNQAGALAQILSIIGKYNFNLRNVKSRPMKSLIWNYYFFVEGCGNIFSDEGHAMIKEIKKYANEVRIIGSYYELEK